MNKITFSNNAVRVAATGGGTLVALVAVYACRVPAPATEAFAASSRPAAPQATSTEQTAPTTAASKGILYDTDFNTATTSVPKFVGEGGATGSVAVRNATGSIDTYMGEPTPALTLEADFSGAKAGARAGVATGALKVAPNVTTDLAKRTVGFDLWVAEGDMRPVRFVIQSLDAAGKVTGSRYATVIPPVAGSYYRFCVDLDKTKPLAGMFDMKAASVQFAWEFSDADGKLPRTAGHALRIDNVSFTAPAYYVSADKGSDTADGRTEATAFATLQKAADVSVPGDTIFVMNGKYKRDVTEHLLVSKGGTPSRWVVFRAYPGHRPEIVNTGWNAVKIVAATAYFEVRGLTARGNRPKLSLDEAKADGLIKEKDGKPYWGDPKFNTNGLSVQSAAKGDEMRPHHIRFIDNTVIDNPGGGMGGGGCDYITIEGNTVLRNCNLMRYGGSGMGTLAQWNFDKSTGYKTFFIRNVSSNNRTFVPWAKIGKISDGNGIIIDCNNNSQAGGSKIPYVGRTLIQNNLVYGNGGTGIHTFRSDHVDVINNTAYHNAQSPELAWRQITANPWCHDVKFINNIWWAQKGKPLGFDIHETCTDIVYQNNLVFGDGDNGGEVKGGLGDEGKGGKTDIDRANFVSNPMFARPSLGADADFHLQKNSPAVDRGMMSVPNTPIIDLDGRPRPIGKSLDLGSYEGF